MSAFARAVKIGLLLVPLAGCGQEPPAGAADSVANRIVLVTDWKAQAEHGGFYEALAEGLYARHGLAVTIREGGPTVNVGQLLAGGAADFGIASNSFIPLNLRRAGGQFKAVMAVFQKDPQVLITHPRDDIRSIADMNGKPIMIGDAAVATFWPWLKAKFGFKDNQIRKYTFNLAPFIVDKSAIQEGYLSSEPYAIEKEGGFKPQVYSLADAGYPGYANMILAPDSWIAAKPQAVQAFVDASIEGWMDYLYADPRPANLLIKKDNPEMTDDLIAQAIEKMRSHGIALSGEADKDGLGAMSDKRWQEFFDVMAAQDVYPRDLNFREAYTLQFVNKGYGLDRHSGATLLSSPQISNERH